MSVPGATLARLHHIYTQFIYGGPKFGPKNQKENYIGLGDHPRILGSPHRAEPRSSHASHVSRAV